MLKPGETPLYPLLNEISIAAVGGLPFLAVSMTVALPDICASLISENGRSNPDRYKAWCKENLGDEFSQITPEDLYSMRCGVLHNGRFGDMQHSCARVIFIPKNPGNNTFSNGRLGDAYLYSVDTFCLNFCKAVHAWFEANRSNENIINNLDRLMQYRYGLSPYIEGIRLLA